MAAVSVTSVAVLNNPGLFTEPLQFEIQYECLTALAHDLEWRLTYVGSADSEEYDQVLDSILLGPIVPGQYKFVLQANAPDPNRLPRDDIVGVTAILLTCLYTNKEFLRIGYFVNSDYPDEESRENPPEVPQIARLVRNILEDKPRVTRFAIEWDPAEQVPTVGGQQQQGDSFMQMDGGKFQQQPGQDQQGGYFGSIPITAQAGVIDEGDGMED